ncbi:hypothetical protein HD841_000565 [Sphingomonas melonis]|uniref:Uncharacterized protein n=1 Tax=Sphingomonas melonis TaxID=152682 RepID=A0A7Y9FK40_9SPHN|nr:hypothetical protein [Sphingomonas melonis]
MTFSEFMQNYGGPASVFLTVILVLIGIAGGDETDGDLPL